MLNSKRQKNRIFTAIILALFLFSSIPANDLAAREVDTPKPVYVDQDMLEITIEENYKKDGYKIGAEYINFGDIDWTVYIIKLNPEDIKSQDDLNKKASDNRAVFSSESTDIETVFVPANSFWKMFDVVSFFIDLAVDFIIDDQDTATVPKDEEAAYLVRAYSGALGLQDDKEEQQFVINDVDLGRERNTNAQLINVFSAVMDASSLLFTLTADMNESPEIKRIILKTVDKLKKDTVISTAKDGDGNATVDEALMKINDFASFFAEEMVIYAANNLTDKAKKEVAAKTATKATKFIASSGKAAINTVNFLHHISKGGQVLNRVYDLVYAATPLETAYIVNKELPEGNEADSWNVYRDQAHGFEIKYPDGWNVSKYGDGFRIFNIEANNAALKASKKAATEWAAFMNGLYVDIENKDMSLEQYIQKRFDSDSGGLLGYERTEIKSQEILKFSEGLEAIKVDYSSDGMGGGGILTLLESDKHIYIFDDFYCKNWLITGSGNKLYEFDHNKICDQILGTFKFLNKTEESESGFIEENPNNSNDLNENFVTFSVDDVFSVQHPDWPRDADIESEMYKDEITGLKAVAKPDDIVIIMLVDDTLDNEDVVSSFEERPITEDKPIKIINKKIAEKGAFIEFVTKDEKAFDELSFDVGHSGLHVIFQSFYKDGEGVFALLIFVVEDKWSEYQEIINYTISTMQVDGVSVNKYILDY